MARKKKTTYTKKKPSSKNVNSAELEKIDEIKRWISILLIVAVTLIAYMRTGLIGVFLDNLQHFLFGRFYMVVMAIIVVQIIVTIINERNSTKNPIAIILILAAVLLACSYFDTPPKLSGFEIFKSFTEDLSIYFQGTTVSHIGGGVIGAFLLSVSTLLLGRIGTILLIVVLSVIAALLLVNLEVYKQAFAKVKEYLSTPDDEEEWEDEAEMVEVAQIEPVQVLPEQKSSFMLQADIPNPTFGDKPEGSASIESKSPYDIRVDLGPAPEDMTLDSFYEEAEVEDLGETRSIFMNVEDLYDKQHQPQVPVTPVISVEENQSVEVNEMMDESLKSPLVDMLEKQMEEENASSQAVNTTSSNVSVKVCSNKPYRLPSITLLDPSLPKPKDDPNVQAAMEKGGLLIQVLRNFDIEARLIDSHIGPAVTKFEIRPDVNVKVSKILNLADDIKMQLAVRDIRIEAPIPGYNAVGVEVPNIKSTPVKMREIINQIPEKEKNEPLLFILGKGLLGNVVTCRLDKMPHMLIAGATGSGKSVCMNTIITSLLLRTKPDEVKMLLIDPKKVEFTPYHKIPHLIGPVINDPAQANNALKVIVKIMDERYDLFSKAGVRNIQVYNEKVKIEKQTVDENHPQLKPLPYIVVIIDELADLMQVAGKEVEGSIQRITQLARAAGIHLIVATQRPSVDVITGVIKSNIPSRIAFAVSSGIDSRTILDQVGAERLLGYGDMLYLPIGQSSATRVQGVFVTDEEVQRITDFVSSEAEPMYDDAFIRLEGLGNEENGVIGASDDPLYDEVKEYVIEAQKASTSLLQRRFGIGYNRAARMIDLLESKGIIGPAQGSKPREVYINRSSKYGEE